MMHYKRERAGRPLTDGPARGEPSGYGRYGLLDDDGEMVLCHECGRRVRSIAAHLPRAHPSMTAREYKLEHGLPLSLGLVSASLHAELAERAQARVGSAAWARLEAARDPGAAASARDAMTFQRAAAIRGPGVSRENGRSVRTGEVKLCPVCGALWCPLPGGYRRITCTDPECWAAWQARSVASHPRRMGARDAAIYAAVTYLGRSRVDVAAEYGITAERVGQIVRSYPS